MALYEEFEPQPNRLIDAQSAYLRSAAYQPIGWYEYGPEAFEEASRENKPVFLDIGALWCHWCHVIDRESYEDPEIATLINENFIPVKVDRDERPDIDARYQLAAQFLTGQGGWPLTLFLTPEGKPFYGGTYFPPEDRDGMVGLKTMLPRVCEAFHRHRHELEEAARVITNRVQIEETAAVAQAALSDETFEHVALGIRTRFNVEQGGFEHGAPKFPHPGAVELALLQWDVSGDDTWRVIAERTLFMMGEGGIYDQLGGGFHRYSTDATWTVPHFEKMGYDNALLLRNYVHAYRATGNDVFRHIAEGILTHLMRDLADTKRGGFYGAQDADNGPDDDGSYWTWPYDEFIKLLTPDETVVLARYFGVRREGNMGETGRNVLHIAELPRQIAAALDIPLSEVQQHIDRGKTKLLQARLRRKMPQIDQNKFTGWNALLASACLDAGMLLNRQDVTELGLHTIDIVLHDAYDPDHGFYHMFHTDSGAMLPGFFEDQAYMAEALLDAFAVSGKRDYLDTARHLLDHCIERYWDDAGGFNDLDRECQEEEATEYLQHPRKLIEDMPMPAPNSIAALALDRLWALTHDERYHDYARRTLEAFAGHASSYGPFAAYYGLAVFFHLHPPATMIVIGRADDPQTDLLISTALETYRPGRQVARFSPEGENLLYPAAPSGEARAYICAGQTCAEPTSDPEVLRETLCTFGKPKLKRKDE